jgi:hypothetical protein
VTGRDFEESFRGQPSQLSRHLHGGTEGNQKSTMISGGRGRDLNQTSLECRFNVTDTRRFLVKHVSVKIMAFHIPSDYVPFWYGMAKLFSLWEWYFLNN